MMASSNCSPNSKQRISPCTQRIFSSAVLFCLATASIAGEAASGIFAGIAPDGALLLQTGDGRLRPVHSGEVRFAALEELRQA